MQDWDPELYRRFEAERTRPAEELLARVNVPQVRVAVDLGCGPANSTELLAKRWPQAAVIGLDSSAAMLEQARERLPDVTFVQADAQQWQAQVPCDLIYANASLQWMSNHAQLLPHLVAQLAAGGALAVQMPDNLEEPSHALMRKVAGEPDWQSKVGGLSRKKLLSTSEYYNLLTAAGCQVDIWRTTYYHVMPAVSSIVDWLRATGLRTYLEPLNKHEQHGFLQRYEAELIHAYPTHHDGSVLLAFPRLFMVAHKA
ncbi:trans-aconitate 2-methyltransferase [Enterobacterales bacterium CwR94]|nr:trans-aconitate 2-methyltransferase [Enterobacterales bacterium CwR94]